MCSTTAVLPIAHFDLFARPQFCITRTFPTRFFSSRAEKSQRQCRLGFSFGPPHCACATFLMALHTAPIASVAGSRAYAMMDLSSNPTALLIRWPRQLACSQSRLGSATPLCLEVSSTLKTLLAPKRDWRCNFLMRRCDNAYCSSDGGCTPPRLQLGRDSHSFLIERS